MRTTILITILVLIHSELLIAQKTNDYKIYQLVIEKSLEQRLKKINRSKIISIVDSTQSLSGHSWVLDDFEYMLFSNPLNDSEIQESKKLIRKLVNDSTSYSINIDSLNIKIRKQSLSKSQLNGLFEESPSDGWNKFYDANKRSIGIINLSSIEYGDKFAAAYVDYFYGGLGASGDVYILEYINNQWMIKTKFNVYKA